MSMPLSPGYFLRQVATSWAMATASSIEAVHFHLAPQSSPPIVNMIVFLCEGLSCGVRDTIMVGGTRLAAVADERQQVLV